MAKYSRDNKEVYRLVDEANSGRTDFICPVCKKSFHLSDAFVTRIQYTEEPDFTTRECHITRMPCYGYRVDCDCEKRLNKYDKICNYLMWPEILCIIVCGLSVTATAYGLLTWRFDVSTIIAALISGLLSWWIDYYTHKYENNFDESLKNNAIVRYKGAWTGEEIREYKKQKELEYKLFFSRLNNSQESEDSKSKGYQYFSDYTLEIHHRNI